ncbi:MAG: hypothetical protein DHS20C15_31540 [Planctomycetota bacterium]|nr:MAG: hypothetical protein DHS20C15_31540 [Planctomycetota bacterium]
MTDHDPATRLRELFHEALALGADQRAASLAKLRTSDPALLDELTELLAEADELGLDAAPDTHVGRRIDRYVLLRELGAGAMGVVYEARQDALGRSVALKVLRAESALREHARARFLEEAETLGRLDHPGIVPIHELGSVEGSDYFTMRLVEGEDFGRLIERVRQSAPGWTLQRALDVLLKVCDAMAFAHDRGVFHRDLKPSHVLVGSFGATYIVDWGLARVVDRPESRDLRLRRDFGDGERPARNDALVTMDGDVLGTPAYMAPEQARGDLARMGAHSDVYSVGAMLYHLLSGAAPFADRDTRSGAEVLELLKAGPPKSLATLPRAVPAELAAICDRAMAREPEQRYATMGELGDDLRAYLEQRVVRAYRTGPLAEFGKWCQRNRRVAAAAVVLLTLVLAGCATVAVTETQRAQQSQARLDELLRLSDVAILLQLKSVSGRLRAEPSDIPLLEDWIAEAEDLLARQPEHRATLESMRARSGFEPVDGTARQRLVELMRATNTSGDTWVFANPDDQWQHDTLARLINELDDFAREGGRVSEARERLALARVLAAGPLYGDRAERPLDLMTALRLLEEGTVGPIVDPVLDGEWFDSLFERVAPEVVLDGPTLLAKGNWASLHEGATIQFPAGVFEIKDLMDSHDTFPRDVTLAGAGRDETLFVMEELSTRKLLERFSMRDATVHCSQYLFDLRREPAIVSMEGVRLTGFDKGSGSSCAFGTEELALRAKDCIIEGGYGRSPRSGQPFDVRTDALLARLENCELRFLNLSLSHIRSGATLVVQDSTLTDIFDEDGIPDQLGPGVRFVNSTLSGFGRRRSEAPHRDLNELFPGWEQR